MQMISIKGRIDNGRENWYQLKRELVPNNLQKFAYLLGIIYGKKILFSEKRCLTILLLQNSRS